MQIRIVAGVQRLLTAAVIAGLMCAPVLASSSGMSPQPGGSTKAGTTTIPGMDNPVVKRPILYPRSNYVWPFSSGPTYGEVDSSHWNDAGVVHTIVGSFDVTRGMPTLPPELMAKADVRKLGVQYFLMVVRPESFADGSFEDLRSKINAQGGAIMQELPVGSFITRMTPGAFDAARAFGGTIALEPYHPAFKISPLLGRTPLPDPQAATSDTYSTEVQIFAGEDPAVFAAKLTALGVPVTRTSADVVYANVHVSKLAAVASLEGVRGIYEALPLFPMAEETTCTMQTGSLNSHQIPYHDAGVKGGGLGDASPQILMVLDSGIQLDAGDLSNTRTDAGTAGAGHRKVLFYGTTNPFGGSGDLLGCDNPTSGGFTHGHTVSVTALGNGTAVAGSYGTGWTATDTNGNPWKLDGVAPRAKVVAYDASVTPASGGCDDPGKGLISPGTLYSGGTGALADGYSRGARTVNFSWGSNSDTYDTNPQQVDSFIFDKGDAMVFIAAGNNGSDSNRDGIPDPSTLGTPATTKNGIAVGASFEQDDQADPGAVNDRAGFSSCGPAGAASRVSPMIMAPGTDAIGGQGFQSEFNCRSSDNDQNNPVECDIVQGLSGTSFSTPAAAGAALLIRDYFAQGLYPDGTSSNPGNAGDQVANISGMLTKAILIASADYMHRGTSTNPNAPGNGLTAKYRFNNEQGYGRVVLANALPLQNYASSVTGLIVADGGIAGGINSTTLTTTLAPSGSTSYNLNVCDTTQPLNIGLAWAEAQSDALAHNLDLELVSPAGRKYIGNFYTDDTNKNGSLDAGENCDYTNPQVPWPKTSTGVIDASPFSIPVSGTGVNCAAGTRADSTNPTEGIHLSPDPNRDGILDNPNTSGVDESLDNQIEAGTWTVTVKYTSGSGNQNYALAISGGVCIGSSVRIQRVAKNNQLAGGTFTCNDQAVVTVNEINTATDPQPVSPSEISSRTRVDVIDAGPDGVFGTGDDVITDTEVGLVFTQVPGTLTYNSNQILLTDGTAPDPGNGALDVRSGQQIRVTYQDKSSGSPDPNQKRVNTGFVNCTPAFSAGGIVFGQFGRDTFTEVSGGCERDARGYFTFGFPDRYIDHGETVGYKVAFQSAESSDTLENVLISLKALAPDADSPVTCKPGTTDCADPNRQNNPPSPYITVTDSPKNLGSLGPGAVSTATFTVVANPVIAGAQQADMLIGISAKTAGKGVESYAVQREQINVDETSFYYNTDFPTGGGPLNYDINNNELLETVTFDPRTFAGDYVFETQTYSDMTATGFNTLAALSAPWNFDSNDGNFRSGLNNRTTQSLITATLAEWGEDKNFNNILDAGEDRDPANGVLNQNWSTNGGCGWQTKGASPSGGMWHTGGIRATSSSTVCLAAGQLPGRCQTIEIQPAAAPFPGNHIWWEMLLTPVLNKVNQCPTVGPGCPTADAPGANVYTVAITDWAWNMEFNLADNNTFIALEFDTDLDKSQGSDLFNDGTVLVSYGGTAVGAVSGGNAPILGGFPLFAPVITCADTDGDGAGDHCVNANGIACTKDYQCTGFGNDTNGTVGNNRVGVNNCFFDGTIETDSTHSGTDSAKALKPWGLATPLDDDVQNGYCARTDTLNGVDKSVSCTGTTSSPQCVRAGAPYSGTCVNPAHSADQFVQANGPGRNFSISTINGPDMRFSTLEDIYGDTGLRFQGALSFINFDPTPNTLQGNTASYGFGVDDMFVSWKEFRLDEDTANHCASGRCADVELQSQFSYGGNNLVALTITDTSPYDPDHMVNDCNDNGVFTDPGDTTDCDGNGVRDVAAHVYSQQEYPGELVFANETAPGSGVWKVNVPYSFEYDSVGSVFVSRAGDQGAAVTAVYVDRDDGTGTPGNPHPCNNNTDPAKNSKVYSDQLNVFVNSGRMAIKGYTITLVGTPGVNGDDDGYPDTNETVDMALTILNKTNTNLTNVVVTLATNDSKIECISKPIVSIASLGSGLPGDPTNVATLPPFRFKVSSTADRTSAGKTANDVYQAVFTVTMHTDTFDITTRTLTLPVDLDLNASGSSPVQQFIEDFEVSSGLGKFTLDNLEAGHNSLALSNGFRCQYNNPDFVNSQSTGDADCFLGFPTDPPTGQNSWHVHKATTAGTPRAYTGGTSGQSLHWGTHKGSTPARDSTRLKALDVAKTINPINLPLASAGPELSFKQQTSLADSRLFNVTPGETADRGVVEVQLADSSNNPIGNWIKIFPYQNLYDQQGTNDFSNCVFDPTDDGNDEDSFFAPGDPLRQFGPSSTCFPEFAFADQGDIDWRDTFDPSKLGRAEGPGLQGSVNRGTWVQPIYNLSAFAARRIRIRFLATSIEVGETQTYDDLLQQDNVTQDDGWYIDDVEIPQALSNSLSLSVDNAINTPVAGVCAACSSVTPNLALDPSTPSSGGPGQVILLEAGGSSVPVCPSGIPQYQFWIDRNNNGIEDTGPAGADQPPLRDWTDSAEYIDAPQVTTTYFVKVRCSSQPACQGAVATAGFLTVNVPCPSTGTLKFAFPGTLSVAKVDGLGGAEPDLNVQASWTGGVGADVVRGNLTTLRNTSGNYTGTVIQCNNNVAASPAPAEANDPGAGSGFYYLARGIAATAFCNQSNSYSTLAPKEAPGRDVKINADANACP